MRVVQEYSDFFTDDGRVFKITNEIALLVPTVSVLPAPYVHTQSSLSNQWTINHNLGYRPIIDVLSPGGMMVIAEIIHVSVNQVQINFNSPQTGTAIAR